MPIPIKIYKSTIFSGCLIFLLGIPYLSHAGKSYLDVVSKPDGVYITINSKQVGKTPLTGLEVPSGDVNIKAHKNGYGSATYTISLSPDELKKVSVQLRSTSEESGEVQQDITIEQDRGDLMVINGLGAVDVYIDGKPRGSGSVKIVKMAAGKHHIKVGSLQKEVTVYRNHLLKVRVGKEFITILNDKKLKDEEERKSRLAKEQQRKEIEFIKNHPHIKLVYHIHSDWVDKVWKNNDITRHKTIFVKANKVHKDGEFWPPLGDGCFGGLCSKETRVCKAWAYWNGVIADSLVYKVQACDKDCHTNSQKCSPVSTFTIDKPEPGRTECTVDIKVTGIDHAPEVSLNCTNN